MRNIAKMLLLLLLLLLFSACDRQDASPNLPEPSPFQTLADTNSGVTLGLEQKEYHIPVQMMNMKIENTSGHLFSYGSFFYVEKKLNDVWYMVMYSDKVFYDFPTFKDFGLILKEGSTEQILPIEKLGITLGPGTYRIVKSFANDENKEILIAVSFKVKKNAS